MCKRQIEELGEGNEGNAENNGWNTRNEMGICIREISVGMRGMQVEMRKMCEIRLAIQGIKWKLNYICRNDIIAMKMII